MNKKFRDHIEALEPSFKALLDMPAVHAAALPREVPPRGIYLFSEGRQHLYVGRSNRIRKRLHGHCRLSSDHNSATFAFRIAREETGNRTREVKILMQLPDARNVAARQAIHGSAPCARTEVTGRAGLEFVCVFGHDAVLSSFVFLDTTGIVCSMSRKGDC